nr:type IIL restriction-modification enzyme MmeI [Komagataeibacter oboediens]
MQRVFSGITTKWKNVDYVGAWLMKAALYNECCYAPFSFVATNSICQGQQVPIIWSILQNKGFRIRFAHSSFKWSNLATNKAGVTVVITGVDRNPKGTRYIYTDDKIKEVNNINPYLTHHEISAVPAERKPLFTSIPMQYGVYYSKSSGLILNWDEKDHLLKDGLKSQFVRRFIGSTEYINGKERYCLWIDDKDLPEITLIGEVYDRIESVRRERLETDDVAVNKLAQRPHQFREYKGDDPEKIFIPIVSSESREYFPAGLTDESVIPTRFRGQRLTVTSMIDSKLPFGGVVGRANWAFGRGMGHHRGAASA